MKKLTILAAAAALSFSLNIQAQDDKKQGDTPKPPEWFTKMDKNHDGKLTEDEVERGWKRIAMLDKNGDGTVTVAEAASRGKAKVKGKMDKVADHDGKGKRGLDRGNAVAGLFTRYDKNKDGSLTQDEAGKAWDRIKGLDTDKSGSVSKEEAAVIAKRGKDRVEKAKDELGEKVKKAEKGGKDRVAGLFARMDKNHDGKITEDEAGEMWKRLSKRDKNGDGVVTADELTGDKKAGGDDGRVKRDGR